jgi:hypothetical protein
MAAGVYSHAAVTFAHSGLRFIGQGDVRIVGTRTQPETWMQTVGLSYTYETAFTDYVVTNVAQRPPVATWRPILVDDRNPPYLLSQGRPFWLDYPIRYTVRPTIALVEAQSCTFFSGGGKVYVHMCHDGPPVPADNLYVGSSGWGALIVDGDDNTLENVTLEQVGGTALKVNLSADRTTLRNVHALASQVWLEGKFTLAEDLEVGYVIAQGLVPNEDCFDANPTFGIGECWQGSGKGDALLIGRQGSTLFLNQTVRRARVHRSWNGVRLDGYNTLEQSTLWGFPNHTLQASGTGAVIRGNIFLNGQDSIYMEGMAFDKLTVEHNVFVNGALVWASRDGRPVGPAPTSWIWRYNLVAGLVLDDRTYLAAQLDCNVYMPSGPTPSHLLKVVSTSGGVDMTFRSLAQIQASTSQEQHSLERPYTDWKTGPMWANFTDQKNQVFSFRDPLSVCGQRVGP